MVGGSLQECNIHGRAFSVAADSDSTRKLGGSENEVLANGNGTVRVIGTITPWSLAGINITIDDDRGDQEFLQDIADNARLGDITLTMFNGKVYQGSGTLTGELGFSSQTATAEVNLMGQGKLTPQ
jgi:osmotically-inducible protein OsmY